MTSLGGWGGEILGDSQSSVPASPSLGPRREGQGAWEAAESISQARALRHISRGQSQVAFRQPPGEVAPVSRSACTTLPHCHPHLGCRPAVATDQETEAQAVERLALGRRAAGPQSKPRPPPAVTPFPFRGSLLPQAGSPKERAAQRTPRILRPLSENFPNSRGPPAGS